MSGAIVTGASGWLGRRLTEALAGRIPELDDLARPHALGGIRALCGPAESATVGAEAVAWLEGDVRDPADLEPLFADARDAVLFHCAGVIHPPGRTHWFRDVNVEGTRNVLEAARRAGVRRAVVVSSNSPFGANAARDERFDERSPYQPYMGYGRSKMEMERVVADVRGIETVVVRPPWFYGPGQPPRQSTFFTMIRKGAFPLVGGGTNLRSLGYVDDLCQGMLRCAAIPEADGETFWLADPEPYETRHIVETVGRLMADEFGFEVSRPKLLLPSVVSDLARVADRSLQALGFYEQRIHVLSEMNLQITCRIDKARRVLGFEPRVGLEEGMRRSLRWCQEHAIEL